MDAEDARQLGRDDANRPVRGALPAFWVLLTGGVLLFATYFNASPWLSLAGWTLFALGLVMVVVAVARHSRARGDSLPRTLWLAVRSFFRAIFEFMP